MMIPKNILAISAAASTDPLRPNLCGVVFERREKAIATATDGHCLIQAKWNELEAGSAPTQVTETRKEGFKALLPNDVLKTIGRQIPKTSFLAVNHAFLDEVGSNGTVPVSTTDLETTQTLAVKPINGEFPDVDGVLKPARTQEVKAFFGVNALLLAETLTAVAKILGGKAPCVKIEVSEAGRPIRIIGTGEAGEEVEALVMPMRL